MDETMFKRLLLAGDDDENFEELVQLGYFKVMNGAVCQTDQYRKEIEEFITLKKGRLYDAVKKIGSTEDIKKVMELASIGDYITFVFIAEELIQEGKMIKKDGNKWTVHESP